MCAASNGQIYAFGCNRHRQLGIENEDVIERPTALSFFNAVESEYRYRQIECGYFHSGVIDADGNAFLFGWNVNGQIGMGSREIKKVHRPFHITAFKCKQISLGWYYTLMLTDNGNEVHACGGNADTQCFQMESGAYVMIPALCTREAMGIGDEERYGDVVRVIALGTGSIIVVEQLTN